MSINTCKTLSSGERGLLRVPSEDSHRPGLDWFSRSLLILDILCFFQKKQQPVLVFIDSSRFCIRCQKCDTKKQCPYQEATRCGLVGGSVLRPLQSKCSNVEEFQRDEDRKGRITFEPSAPLSLCPSATGEAQGSNGGGH